MITYRAHGSCSRYLVQRLVYKSQDAQLSGYSSRRNRRCHTPAMGWLAGSGNLLDGRLGALCFFILMWQIPHVLLHLLVNRTDYEQSECPSLLALFSGAQLRRLAFLCLTATAVSAQTTIGFGLLHTALTMAVLLTALLILIVRGIIFISASH